MIEWLLKFVAALFTRNAESKAVETLAKANEGCGRANEGLDRLTGRQESRIIVLEAKVDEYQLKLADCLMQRLEDAQKLIDLEAVLRAIEPNEK